MTLGLLAYYAVHSSHTHIHQNDLRSVCSLGLCSGAPGELVPECDRVRGAALGKTGSRRIAGLASPEFAMSARPTFNSRDLPACWG